MQLWGMSCCHRLISEADARTDQTVSQNCSTCSSLAKWCLQADERTSFNSLPCKAATEHQSSFENLQAEYLDIHYSLILKNVLKIVKP